MRTFEKWDKLENNNCKVIINHKLFDEQVYECEMLQTINDDHRIGIVMKGRELFVNKNDLTNFLVCDNFAIVTDDMMAIVIVKKM